MPSLHKIIALLLFVVWTPVASHCLIEGALGHEETGCCESGGPAESGHSECSTCLSVENGQPKSAALILPAPSVLDEADDIFQLLLSGSIETRTVRPVILQVADTPPVPPADIILLATLAQPVRGPSLIA